MKKKYRGYGFQGFKKFYEKTGEVRRPLKGEYYLSGAIPEVYKALSDMTDPFYIMKEVEPPPTVITYRGCIYTRVN